jgi:hypothetical protein
VFYLFKELRSGGIVINIEQLLNPDQPANAKPMPKTHIFLLERMEKMDRDSVFAAIQVLLDENAPASALLPFTRRMMHTDNATAVDLREQMRIRLLDLKANTPAEQFALANFFEQAGDAETAREMLFTAWQIRQLTPSPTSDGNYTALARRLDVAVEEIEALPPPTQELCEQFGFILLTPENTPMEVDIEANKEARFVAISSDGQLSLLQFTVYFENGKLHQTEMLITTYRGHGRSQTRIGRGAANFWEVLPVGDQEGIFRFSLVSESATDNTIRVRIEFVRRSNR